MTTSGLPAALIKPAISIDLFWSCWELLLSEGVVEVTADKAVSIVEFLGRDLDASPTAVVAGEAIAGLMGAQDGGGDWDEGLDGGGGLEVNGSETFRVAFGVVDEFSLRSVGVVSTGYQTNREPCLMPTRHILAAQIVVEEGQGVRARHGGQTSKPLVVGTTGWRSDWEMSFREYGREAVPPSDSQWEKTGMESAGESRSTETSPRWSPWTAGRGWAVAMVSEARRVSQGAAMNEQQSEVSRQQQATQRRTEKEKEPGCSRRTRVAGGP